MSLLHPSSGRLGRARGPLADYSWPSAAKGAFLRSREIMSELWNARAAAKRALEITPTRALQSIAALRPFCGAATASRAARTEWELAWGPWATMKPGR